jgi:hypothetical protein
VLQHHVAVNVDNVDRNWHLSLGRPNFHALGQRLGCREQIDGFILREGYGAWLEA